MTNDHHKTTLPETGFLRLPQVLELIPVGKSSWWAGVKEGRYPEPVKLSVRTTAWRVEDRPKTPHRNPFAIYKP